MPSKPTASTVLIDELRKHGLEPVRLWHVPGPKSTNVVWISAYNVNGVVVMVQTYAEGWDAFTPCQSVKTADTVADVIARVTPGAHA